MRARQDAPRSRAAHTIAPAGRRSGGAAAHVLALQRAVGNRATMRLLQREPDDQAGAHALGGVAAQLARRDFVFIMGADRGGFYTLAERYFRAQNPNARFVTNVRTLRDLLAWVVANVNDPIGELYIVSHANEDGTLSFGLQPGDEDRHLDVRELRAALDPDAGGPALPQVGDRVDGLTRIHIKGCDIGRTPGMVELIDEAFGGAGVVTAPTHEQVYGWDPTLAEAARRRFREEVAAAHAMPDEIDPALTGAERRRAVRERERALRARRRAIEAELRARRGEESAAGQRAGRYEALSGPMFQRPGDQRFTADEIRPEVDRLYAHLSEEQRQALVTRLIAPDARSSALAHRQGTFRQRGQRAYTYQPFSTTFWEPQTVAEANALFRGEFRRERFTATAVTSTREDEEGGFRVRIVVEGRVREGRRRSRDTTMEWRTQLVEDDDALIAEGQAMRSNPDRYEWSVEERHAGNGTTTRRAVAKRVVAYLHHGSLDRAAHEHFTRPLTDTDFYVESVFAPPEPAAAP